MSTDINFWLSCLVWLAGLSGWVSAVILIVKNTVITDMRITPGIPSTSSAQMPASMERRSWMERRAVNMISVQGARMATKTLALAGRGRGKIASLALKLVTTDVSLATAIGLSLFCFISGMLVRDYWKEKVHDTYSAGYQARDVEAYSGFVNRPQTHWKVINSYIDPHEQTKAYDLELTNGQIIRHLVTCEDPGWYIGLVITGAGYYNKGSCMSFHGPQSYIITSPVEPKILQTKGSTP